MPTVELVTPQVLRASVRKRKSRLATAFLFTDSAPVTNGGQIDCPCDCLSCLGGQCQGFDLGSNAALIASSFVLVEDALVGDRVQHGLCLGKQFSGLGLVARCNSLFHVLDGGTVFGTQRGVSGVQLHVLAGALAARCQTGVLFDWLRCHDV